jgi:[glutamine synthetase] adenylyltransferase / [glutamine synthetase]-adenylyl-L-tyrosine phosphorylase
VRLAVITAERDAESLADEIVAMRDKVRAAHRVPSDRFDVKHSVGGMVDVEFVVQYLVLAHSHAHPEMQPNLGNIKMLHRAEKVGLLPAGMGAASADAYRTLRKIQHRARLDETSTQIEPERVEQEVAAVRALWAHVLGDRQA